jgi:DNA-directed RNA polymerase subunit RPC12/RpoP
MPTAMSPNHVAKTIVDGPVPLIGQCPECRAQIFASHPYAWCVRCGKKLPYRLNMERRPIMYEKCAVWPFDVITTESKDN